MLYFLRYVLSSWWLAGWLALTFLSHGALSQTLSECDVDVLLVLDSSVSLRDYDRTDKPLQTWKLVTSFTKSFISSIPREANVRVGVIKFSDRVVEVEPLTQRSSWDDSKLNRLDNLEFIGSTTNMAAALDNAKNKMSDGNRKRVVVVLTDGLANVNRNKVNESASLLKQAGVTLYTIGLTKYCDDAALSEIATEPADYYYIKLIGIGILDIVRNKAVHRVCDVPEPPEVPVPACTTVPHCKHCLVDPEICDECEANYYRDGWICSPCPPFCDICTSASTCVQCSIGYFMDPSTGKCFKCLKGLDLAFLVDASGSIRDKNPKKPNTNEYLYDNYQIILQFVVSIIDRLSIGPGDDSIRVAEIIFSNYSNVYFHLNKFLLREDIKKAVSSSYYEGSYTNTADALNLLRTEIFQTSNGDRPGVANVGIIITDGKSTVNTERTIPEARACHQAGITIFAVGVTNDIDRHELEEIASKPASTYLFYSDNIINLANDVLVQLANTLCNGPQIFV